MLTGPGDRDRFDSAIRTVAAWDAGRDLGLELHGVEVPPVPLLAGVVPRAGSSALRAGQGNANMPKRDFNSLLVGFQSNTFDPPGRVQAQQQAVVFGEFAHAPQDNESTFDDQVTHENA